MFLYSFHQSSHLWKLCILQSFLQQCYILKFISIWMVDMPGKYFPLWLEKEVGQDQNTHFAQSRFRRCYRFMAVFFSRRNPDTLDFAETKAVLMVGAIFNISNPLFPSFKGIWCSCIARLNWIVPLVQNLTKIASTNTYLLNAHNICSWDL